MKCNELKRNCGIRTPICNIRPLNFKYYSRFTKNTKRKDFRLKQSVLNDIFALTVDFKSI